MAISKKDEWTIKKIMMESFREIQSDRLFRDAAKEKCKQTEQRLYAYQVIKKNIERYKLDILDIQHEDMKRSKDFVLFLRNSGGSLEKPNIEELRAVKILILEQKIARDEKELAEIDVALQEMRNDDFFNIIPMKYIDKISHEEIAMRLHCDIRTIGRHKKRLIRDLALRLYGADAL